jgi:hypothetical protein
VTVERDLGRIPYEEFSDETNAKSGLRQDEPIVYVEGKAGTEAPTGWRSQGFFFTRAGQGPTHRKAFDAKAPEPRWEGLTKQAETGISVHAPHTFATFSDVQERGFAISAFEVDGRYLGRAKERRIMANAGRL